MRCMGIMLSVRPRSSGSSNFSAFIGVSIAPGAMQFARIPRWAYSSAMVFVYIMMPLFVAA